MLQFSQEYINHFLKPFIAEVLTDMSTCEQKKEPMYLYKILNNIEPDEHDKTNFENRYFRSTQPSSRPFKKEEEAPFRKMFMDNLEEHVKMRRRLAQQGGMRAALLPDKEAGRTFGGHEALTLNLVRLSFQMAANFEKEIIKGELKNNGTYNNKNKEKLAGGQLKLVATTDGSGTEIMTEEEIAQMARTNPGAKLIPFLTPGLLKNLEQTAVSPAVDNALNPLQESANPITLLKDFENAKLAYIRQLIMASGLEITQELKISASGIVTGVVSDVEGQQLSLYVDTKKPSYAADKFIFTFLNKGPSKHLANKKITLSQDDVKNAFYGEEGRKKAIDVYKKQGGHAEMAGQNQAVPRRNNGGNKGAKEKYKTASAGFSTGEGRINGAANIGPSASEEITVENLPVFQPGKIAMPTAMPTANRAVRKPSRKGSYKIKLPQKPVLQTSIQPSIAAKKLAMKSRVPAGGPAPFNPSIKQKIPPFKQAGTGQPGKQKMQWPAKVGIGAAAGAAGLFGITAKVHAASAAAVAAINPATGRAILSTIKIVLNSFGINYPI